jgi:hypothetical protein
VQLIDVGAFAGTKAKMMQPDAILLERATSMLGRRRADRNGRASADSVIDLVAIDHRLQPNKRQQFSVELARALEIRCGQENMGNAVDFHRLPFQPPRGVGLRAMTLFSSIQEFD